MLKFKNFSVVSVLVIHLTGTVWAGEMIIYPAKG